MNNNNTAGEIKIGDYLQSESCSKHPVKVTGITEEGDYITDELDFHEAYFQAVFVIDKKKAIKVPDPNTPSPQPARLSAEAILNKHLVNSGHKVLAAMQEYAAQEVSRVYKSSPDEKGLSAMEVISNLRRDLDEKDKEIETLLDLLKDFVKNEIYEDWNSYCKVNNIKAK